MVVGVGVGVLIGVGIVSGDDCENLCYCDNCYNDCYDCCYDDWYDDCYFGKLDDCYQDSYYDDGYFLDDYGYIDGFDSYLNGELFGGVQFSQNVCIYNVLFGYSFGVSYNFVDWVCEYQIICCCGLDGYVGEVQVYMCQGNDGIWCFYDMIVGNQFSRVV